jgi:hypothetical protein
MLACTGHKTTEILQQLRKELKSAKKLMFKKDEEIGFYNVLHKVQLHPKLVKDIPDGFEKDFKVFKNSFLITAVFRNLM